MSSSVSEVVASNPGGREFCSCAILNRAASEQRDNYIGVSPVADTSYTGVVDGFDVCYDGPMNTTGYTVQFFLRVVNQQDPSLVFQTLHFFRVRLINPNRPMFFKFNKPLNFVCPPGYFLCCHYHAQADYAEFLSTANVRWKSYNVA